MLSPSVDNLVAQLTRLPGIGTRTAQRLAFHLLATGREEALALIKRTRETALVEMQNDEVNVSFPASTWPAQAEGQFALAQQFARADEIVEGKKRRIFFYNPSGRLFAQSDGVTGVTVMR